jgi:Flp pilus assembly protein CpaB
MNRRVLILLLIVVVVIGGGVLLYTNLNKPPDTPAVDPNVPVVVVDTPTPLVVTPILVAIQELPRGIRIPENALALRNWPQESVPAGAIDPKQINEVVGKIARTDIVREQPILSSMLVDDLTQVAKVGSDAAAVIPPGLQAITIPIDRDSAVGYAPRPGDYVDVIASFLYVDVDEEFQSRKPNLLSFTTIKQDGTIDIIKGIQGRLEPSSFSQFPVVVGPSETQRPRLTTQRTIQSALVIQLGTFPLSGNYIGNTPTPNVPPTVPAESGEPTKGPPPPTATLAVPEVITLAVRPQDAVVLAWLKDQRVPITLTLRNTRDLAAQPSTQVTLRYIVENYQVAPPPRLPYALEPALRSIRQIVSGTLVPFAEDSTGSTGSGGK